MSFCYLGLCAKWGFVSFVEVSFVDFPNWSVDYPSDLAKHNKVRATIKNSNLSKYYTRNPITKPLFSFTMSGNMRT